MKRNFPYQVCTGLTLLVLAACNVTTENIQPLEEGEGAEELVPGAYVQEFEHEEETRRYLIYIPEGTGPEPPVVFNMHGAGSSAEGQVADSRYNLVADTAGCVIVYPEASPSSGYVWETADTSYLREVIDAVTMSYSVDTSRFYATGFSAGGFMANAVGHAFSERFAAIAPVAGGFFDDWFDWPSPTYGMSTCFIHSIHDEIVAYEDAQAALQQWKEWNGISGDSTAFSYSDSPQVDLSTFPEGRNGATMEFYTLYEGGDGGHVWSREEDGGLSAEVVTWQFFRDKSRR